MEAIATRMEAMTTSKKLLGWRPSLLVTMVLKVSGGATMGETGVAGIYKQKALAWLGFVSTHIKHMEIRLKLGFISHDQPLANGRCFLGLKPSEKATPEKKRTTTTTIVLMKQVGSLVLCCDACCGNRLRNL